MDYPRRYHLVSGDMLHVTIAPEKTETWELSRNEEGYVIRLIGPGVQSEIIAPIEKEPELSALLNWENIGWTTLKSPST